jgi:hypothetical protein
MSTAYDVTTTVGLASTHDVPGAAQREERLVAVCRDRCDLRPVVQEEHHMGGGLVLVHEDTAGPVVHGASNGRQGGTVLPLQAGEKGHAVVEAVVVPCACKPPGHTAAPVFTCADALDAATGQGILK